MSPHVRARVIPKPKLVRKRSEPEGTVQDAFRLTDPESPKSLGWTLDIPTVASRPNGLPASPKPTPIAPEPSAPFPRVRSLVSLTAILTTADPPGNENPLGTPTVAALGIARGYEGTSSISRELNAVT